MKLFRVLSLSLRAVLAQRTRSLLAASAVAGGVASVLLTSAIGEGARDEMMRDLGKTGTRLLVVRPTRVRKSNARKELQGPVTTLRPEDLQSIAELALVVDAAPAVEGSVRVSTGRGRVATQVLGTTSAFFRVRCFEQSRGRVFDEAEDRGLSRVAVLGGRLTRSLFPEGDAVGREVRLGTVRFEVIGSLVEKGAAADGSDADNQVFVPLHTALRRLFNSRSLSAIFIGVRRSEDLLPVEDAVRERLRERHLRGRDDAPDDFEVQSQLRLLAAQRQTEKWLTLLVSGLVGVSLLVGGTGILALMLLSVRERTPEIGLRLALGACGRDILIQFWAEAMALSLAGGAVGVGLGAAGALAVSSLTRWPAPTSPGVLLIGLAQAAAIGILFGALPARRAALLTPIQALAME